MTIRCGISDVREETRRGPQGYILDEAGGLRGSTSPDEDVFWTPKSLPNAGEPVLTYRVGLGDPADLASDETSKVRPSPTFLGMGEIRRIVDTAVCRRASSAPRCVMDSHHHLPRR